MVGIQIQFTNGSSLLNKNGYTLKEEADIYDFQIKDLLENTRWYLDNFEYMREFRVSWIDYKTQKATKPYTLVCEEDQKYAKKRKLYK